jgi:hypothetical protein
MPSFNQVVDLQLKINTLGAVPDQSESSTYQFADASSFGWRKSGSMATRSPLLYLPQEAILLPSQSTGNKKEE